MKEVCILEQVDEVKEGEDCELELSWSSDQYGELVKSNRTNSGLFLCLPVQDS